MIYEHFRATEIYEAIQGLSDLSSLCLQNDDIQHFDVRWDQGPLSASDMPSDVILEGLYKSKLQDSVQLGSVRPRRGSKQWVDKLFTIDNVCKTSS